MLGRVVVAAALVGSAARPSPAGERPSVSWNAAREECESRGQGLCSSEELCPTGAPFDGGVYSSDTWVPVSDGSDEWLQYGKWANSWQPGSLCSLHSVQHAPDPHPCHTHQDPVRYPDAASCGHSFLYCCSGDGNDSGSCADGLCYTLYSGEDSPSEAEDRCEDRGGHLAKVTTAGQVATVKYVLKDVPDGNCVRFGAIKEAGSWQWTDGTAVSAMDVIEDTGGEYCSCYYVNDDNVYDAPCHGGWGQGDYYLCATSEGDGEDYSLTYYDDGSGQTYEWMKSSCATKGKRLCTYGELCPNGGPHQAPYGGQQASTDMWAPITPDAGEGGSTNQDWVQIGTRDGGMCNKHSSFYGGVHADECCCGDWCNTNVQQEWKRIYACCDGEGGSSTTTTGTNCRSDICTDYAEDCCAPGDEPRGCSLAGYEVQDDWVGSSGWPSCVSTYGQESVYQCCSTSSTGSSDALFVAGPSGGDYDDAVAYCSSIGASIATIYSATENELARQACGGSSCWIGLEEVGGSASTPKASQTWRWMDGSTASYTNWLSSEPQNHNGRDERNAIMNCCDTNGVDASGSWYDAPDDYGAPKPLCRTDDSGGSSGSNCDRSLCSSVADDCCAPLSIGEAATCRNGYVAQRTGNGCFGYGEGDYTCCSTSASSEFSFVANVGSWSNGRAQCQSRGGDLATIHSAAEDAAAKAVVPSGSSAWFGLSDTTTEGSYAWVDGSALDYINWAGGEPNNWGGNEDCGGYYKGHTSGWADGGCDEWEGADPVGAVCSIPGSSTGSDDDSFTFVAGSQACLFDFEDTAIDSCPSGWTCTGDARVVSRYTCVSGCGTPLPLSLIHI